VWARLFQLQRAAKPIGFVQHEGLSHYDLPAPAVQNNMVASPGEVVTLLAGSHQGQTEKWGALEIKTLSAVFQQKILPFLLLLRLATLPPIFFLPRTLNALSHYWHRFGHPFPKHRGAQNRVSSNPLFPGPPKCDHIKLHLYMAAQIKQIHSRSGLVQAME